MGNKEAGRPVATLSQTPGNPKRLQQKREVDAINHNHQRNIQGSQPSKEMPHSAYVNHLTKLNRKLEANKWYTSGDFQEAKRLLDNGCPQLQEGINYEARGLKWYRGSLMPLSYYPCMDDGNNVNRLCTISPSVPPDDHGIPPTNHGISVPPPSTDKSKILPLPTPSTKGKEKENDESNIGGLLKDLAEDGSEDGTSTPTEKDASTVPPAPTAKDASTITPVPMEKDAIMIPPAPTKEEAGITPPAPPGKEAGTTPEKPTASKQQGTPKHDQPATPSSESSSLDNNEGTKEEDYLSCVLEELGLDPDSKRMLDNETNMLAHHKRKLKNKAIPIVKRAVNEDSELLIEAWAQVTAVFYAMREVIVRFHTRLGNISYFTSRQGKRKAGTEGGKRKWVCKE